MTKSSVLIQEIENLPSKYYGEVLNFVEYLRQKEHTESEEFPVSTMLLSEEALAKDWNTPEEDEAWASL